MFQHSIKFGRLFKIDLAVTPFWFVIYLFLSFQMALFFRTEGVLSTTISMPLAGFLGFILIGLMYVSILAHEYGHSLTARLFGINTKRIILHVFGGVALLEGEPKSSNQEFWITIMGPAVSLALSIGFGIGWLISALLSIEILALCLMYLSFINLIMFLFNLLPGFPMDGGRLLRSALWAATGNYLQSTKIAGMGGRIVGYSIAALGVYRLIYTEIGITGGILNIVAGLFIAQIAARAVQEAEITNVFRNKTVRELMRPTLQLIPSDATVFDAVAAASHYQTQELFPVIHNQQIIGQVTLHMLLQIPSRQHHWIRVGEICQPIESGRMISADVLAITALEKLSAGRFASLAVFDGRRLLGFIYGADLMSKMP